MTNNLNAAVFTTQFITSLSAVATLTAKDTSITSITFISLRHPSFKQHADLIKKRLVPLTNSLNLKSRFIYEDELEDETSFHIMSTPRIDHQASIKLMDRIKPIQIIETGESIGVEPQLYSLKSRIRRASLIKSFENREYLKKISYQYSLMVNNANTVLLEQLLNLTNLLKNQSIGNNTPSSSQDLSKFSSSNHTILLLLPFIPNSSKNFPTKVINWFNKRILRKRIKSHEPIKSRQSKFILQSSQQVIDRRISSSNKDFTLCLKFHPKNKKNEKVLAKYYESIVSSNRNVSLELLPADVPIESIIYEFKRFNSCQSLDVYGYGTNLLAVSIFLANKACKVRLCELGGDQNKLKRMIKSSIFALTNQTEYLRRKHVKRLLNNLNLNS